MFLTLLLSDAVEPVISTYGFDAGYYADFKRLYLQERVQSGEHAVVRVIVKSDNTFYVFDFNGKAFVVNYEGPELNTKVDQIKMIYRVDSQMRATKKVWKCYTETPKLILTQPVNNEQLSELLRLKDLYGHWLETANAEES